MADPAEILKRLDAIEGNTSAAKTSAQDVLKRLDEAEGRSRRDVVYVAENGGTVTRGPNGLGYSDDVWTTSDPEAIKRIMAGEEPAKVSRSGWNQDTIAQAPFTARAQEFVRGFPFIGSFIDELAGAVKGEGARDNSRALHSAMAEEKPGQTTALNIAGAVTGSAPIAVAAAPVLEANAAPTVGARAIQGMTAGGVVGAVEGGVYGAGEGKEGERAGSAMEGAIFGGVAGSAIGAASPYIAEAIKRSLIALKGSPEKVIAQELGVSPRAAAIIRNALDKDDPQGAFDALRRAGDDAMLADAGQAGRELLDASAAAGGQAGSIARAAVEGRVTKAADDIQTGLDRAFGKPSTGKEGLKAGIRAGTKDARGDAYDLAYSTPIDYASGRGMALESLLGRIPKGAIKDANDLMRLEGVQSKQILATVADNGKVTYERLPDVRQLHYILQALEGTAAKQDAKGALGGTTPLGRSTKALASDIRKVLKAAVPEFAQAQDIAADAIKQTQATDMGYKLLRSVTTREQVNEALKGASKSERDAMAQGVRTYIDDTLANVTQALTDPNMDAREGLKVLKDLSSRANRSKLYRLLGEARAETLYAELDRASTAYELRAALAMNSKTAIRQSIQGNVKDQAAPGALEVLASGSPLDAGKRMVQVFTGNTSEAQALRESGIFEDIARGLTNVRGAQAERALKVVQTAIAGGNVTAAQARLVGQVMATDAFLAADRAANSALTTR